MLLLKSIIEYAMQRENYQLLLGCCLKGNVEVNPSSKDSSELKIEPNGKEN